VSKGIRKSEADIRRLTKGKGILEDLLPDPGPAVQSWASKLASNLQTSIKDALSSNILGTAGAVVGVALGPSIGAGIATAVTGTVGLGGVIGGLALAAKNPAVKAQAHHIGSTFMAGITEQAETSFAGPMQNVLGKLSAFASASVPKIGRIFANTAPSVGLLADNLSRAGAALLDSFVYASAKSGPALAALGKLTQGVAEDVGKFIQTMSDHSAEGASAIDELTSSLHHLVETASGVVSGLASLKGVQDGIDKWIDDKRSWLEDHSHFLDATADGYKRGSEAAAKLYRQGVIGAAGSVNDYNHYLAAQAAGTHAAAGAMNAAARAARGERNALSDLAAELHAQTDPAFALIRAQNTLKKAQEGAASATKKHGANSWQAREATRKLAEAAIDLQGKVGALGSSFTGKLSPAMLNTLRAAGLTKGQIAAVAREFQNAKHKGDAFARKYAAAIALQGIGKSIADINRLQAKIFGLRGKMVTVGTRVVGYHVKGGTIPFAKGGITHAATGALRDASIFTSVGSGARYAFAEPSTGGEAFIPRRGDTARSRKIWEYVGQNWLGARPGGGGQVAAVTLDFTGADQEFARFLLKILRTTPSLKTAIQGG
jgi:hypothetical protein